MVLGECACYWRALWRYVLSIAIRSLSALTHQTRIHDFCARVAQWQRQPRYQQLHVFLDLPGLLQYALGVVSFMGLVRGIRQYQLGVCQGQWRHWYRDQENKIAIWYRTEYCTAHWPQGPFKRPNDGISVEHTACVSYTTEEHTSLN